MTDEWIDDTLLQGDARSIAGWRARAIGMPVNEAMKRVPRRGMLQCWVPIEPYRTLQAHIRTSGLSQARWLRRAVIAAYLAEGGNPTVADELNQIGPPGGNHWT